MRLKIEGVGASSYANHESEPSCAPCFHADKRVIVDEGWRSGSLSAEIGMRIAEEAFFELDAPPRRICGREVPMPYAAHLEDACLPQTETIVAVARDLVRPS